jgi:hypothetical protein
MAFGVVHCLGQVNVSHTCTQCYISRFYFRLQMGVICVIPLAELCLFILILLVTVATEPRNVWVGCHQTTVAMCVGRLRVGAGPALQMACILDVPQTTHTGQHNIKYTETKQPPAEWFSSPLMVWSVEIGENSINHETCLNQVLTKPLSGGVIKPYQYIQKLTLNFTDVRPVEGIRFMTAHITNPNYRDWWWLWELAASCFAPNPTPHCVSF